MTIESDNAREEIREIVEKCINCGMCKPRDSLFKVMREEQYSPRGKAIMLKNNQYDPVLFDDNLSKQCEVSCPLKIKMHEAIIKARKVLVEEKKDPETVKEAMKNLRKTGNIFGDKGEEK
jgi:Fe-S oxidoreductase